MDEYSAYVREFRQLVLDKYQQQPGNRPSSQMKSSLKQIFREIDGNNDGIVTATELRQFIHALEIQLTPHSNQNISFSEILLHQIDIDNDGRITYQELMDFLWPKEISKREIGAVINKIRLALMSSIQWKYKKLKDLDDVTLIEAFAKLTGAPLLRGNLVEVRSLRKAFSKINNPTLGDMSKYEVDVLVTSLDANSDGVVSSREFRKWLLRVEDEIDFPPSMMEEIEAIQNGTEYAPRVEPVEVESPMAPPLDPVETESPLDEVVEAESPEEVPTETIDPVANESPPEESVVDEKEESVRPVDIEPIDEPVEPKSSVEPELLGSIEIKPTMTPEDIPLESLKIEETPLLVASVITPQPVPVVQPPKRSERSSVLIGTSPVPLETTPLSSNTSLNQRRNKTTQDQQKQDSRVKVSNPATPLLPSAEAGADAPTEQRESSCLRWMALFGLGVLMIYAVYRGDLWLPKPSKSLIK
jgi:Ca2+-binding EF-hand superfamily protein